MDPAVDAVCVLSLGSTVLFPPPLVPDREIVVSVRQHVRLSLLPQLEGNAQRFEDFFCRPVAEVNSALACGSRTPEPICDSLLGRFREPAHGHGDKPELARLLSPNGKISGASQQYPDAYPKEYRQRVEKFSRNYIWRKITIEFLEAAVERMFTADEVSTVVEPAKLKELKHRIVHLFLYADDSGRNYWGMKFRRGNYL